MGLEFTKQYLEIGDQVIASYRNPEKAKNLHDLKKLFPDTLTIIQLDVTKENEREKTFDQIQKEYGSIDTLINNAGIISGDSKNLYNLGGVHKEDFMKILQINSLAPLLMSEKFLPLLEKGTNSKIINISSQNGSITQRIQGGKYSYCTSKQLLI